MARYNQKYLSTNPLETEVSNAYEDTLSNFSNDLNNVNPNANLGEYLQKGMSKYIAKPGETYDTPWSKQESKQSAGYKAPNIKLMAPAKSNAATQILQSANNPYSYEGFMLGKDRLAPGQRNEVPISLLGSPVENKDYQNYLIGKLENEMKQGGLSQSGIQALKKLNYGVEDTTTIPLPVRNFLSRYNMLPRGKESSLLNKRYLANVGV